MAAIPLHSLFFMSWRS